MMEASKTIFIEELKDALKDKRIIFVIIIAGIIFLTIYVSGFLQTAYLIFFKPGISVPFPISVSYYLLFFLMPIFIALIGHDSISSEIENGTIRGVITKIRRGSFIAGKALAGFTIVSALNLILMIIAMVYSYSKGTIMDFGHAFGYFLFLACYCALWSALTILFSAALSKSSTVLWSVAVVYVGLLYLSIKFAKGSFAYYLNPLNYAGNVSTLDNGIIGIIVFLIYTTIFFAGSIWIFRGKDL